MNWRFLIFFACLPFLFYAQEEMDPRVFAKRLQTEIAVCRQQADAVRKAVEEDWKRHEEHVQTLQKESDELLKQLEQLENEIAKLQEENHETAMQNAVAKTISRGSKKGRSGLQERATGQYHEAGRREGLESPCMVARKKVPRRIRKGRPIASRS